MKRFFFGLRMPFAVVMVLTLVIVLATTQYLIEQLGVNEQCGRHSSIEDLRILDIDSLVGSHKYKVDYQFTVDWFSPHIPTWEAILAPYRGKPEVKYLEIGVYEGRAILWMLENILTDDLAYATGLDIFEGYYDTSYVEGYAKRYFDNIEHSKLSHKVASVKGFSQVELRKLPLESFDIIYIDGSHVNKDVMEDAILSLRLLKPGGIMILDDYGDETLTDPSCGIEAFYKFFSDQLEVVHKDYQLFLRKR